MRLQMLLQHQMTISHCNGEKDMTTHQASVVSVLGEWAGRADRKNGSVIVRVGISEIEMVSGIVIQSWHSNPLFLAFEIENDNKKEKLRVCRCMFDGAKVRSGGDMTIAFRTNIDEWELSPADQARLIERSIRVIVINLNIPTNKDNEDTSLFANEEEVVTQELEEI
jgi:hypothetical protein